jgi:serine/threonine-protein kinase HipA
MRALWRRIVFSVLISNTDERLSPAYDLNPVPTYMKPRVLTTAIDLDDGTASLKLAMDVAGYFELAADEAAQIAAEVGKAVAP